MKNKLREANLFWPPLLVLTLLVSFAHAGNTVLAEVHLDGKSHVEKTSGVWVDGQYVGYLKELKGSKALLLLPGEHEIMVRQNGYQDFVQRITVVPARKYEVHVAMSKGETGVMPAKLAQVKLEVDPSRAAVFVDGTFVGHVGEFEGLGRGMLVAPGKHQIRIALPGYETFEAQIDPLPDQKVKIKTDLVKSLAAPNDPMIKPDAAPSASTTPGAVQPVPR